MIPDGKAVISEVTKAALQAERYSQHLKFGHEPKATQFQMGLILGEEYGEICRAICQRKDRAEIEKEVIQLAAVCIAWLDGDLHWGDEK